MAYGLENIAILSAKGSTSRCILLGISKNEGLKRLKDSVLEDKGVLKIYFNPKKKLIEVIKESAFGITYFRDIYSGINGKWYKKSWKEFGQLKDIDQKYYSSDYCDVSVNKHGVKCRILLRAWENKDWINGIDPYGWFQWYFRYWLGRRLEDDKRQINRWKKL